MPPKVTKFSDLFAPLPAPEAWPDNTLSTIDSDAESSSTGTLPEPLQDLDEEASEASTSSSTGTLPEPPQDLDDVASEASTSSSTSAETSDRAPDDAAARMPSQRDAKAPALEATEPVLPSPGRAEKPSPPALPSAPIVEPAAAPLAEQGAALQNASSAPVADAGQGDRALAGAPGSQEAPFVAMDEPQMADLGTPAEARLSAPFAESQALPQVATGSIFNLQGLDEAFPVMASETQDENQALVSSQQALHAAEKLGAHLSLESLTRAQSTPLPDGSVLLTAPTQAVAMTHVNARCAKALSSAKEAPETISNLLQLLRGLDLSRPAQRDVGALAQALQALQGSPLLDCDERTGASLKETSRAVQQLAEVLDQQTATELTYLRHLNDFRTMKKDLKALSDVLKNDGARVARARAKSDALLQHRGEALARRLSQLEGRLKSFLIYARSMT